METWTMFGKHGRGTGDIASSMLSGTAAEIIRRTRQLADRESTGAPRK